MLEYENIDDREASSKELETDGKSGEGVIDGEESWGKLPGMRSPTQVEMIVNLTMWLESILRTFIREG